VDDHAGCLLRNFFLLFGVFLLLTRAAFADIGIVVLEPIKGMGYVTRAGQAATYLSNICPDGGPLRMRLCRPGEHGGVVSKHASSRQNAGFDWAIVPFDEFLNGVADPELAPIIATAPLREAIRARHGSSPMSTDLAARFDRTLYVFSIPTTRGDDQRIVDVFNRTSNTARYNVFYDNSSDQARAFFSLVMPRDEGLGDRIDGLTMETPKGLAKALVEFARTHPEFPMRAERYAQTPGIGARSYEVLFPMENVYRNPSFAPYWFFGGFRELAVGAFLYYKLFARFSVPAAFRRFSSPAAADLTKRQRQSYAAEFQNITGQPADGRTARRLLKDFDARGVFSVDELGPGPWMTLPLSNEQETSTGLSPSQIGAGDPHLAFIILTAAIDYQLAAAPQRRASAGEIERLFELLRDTRARLDHVPATQARLSLR
jgi:hypothetical protein